MAYQNNMLFSVFLPAWFFTCLEIHTEREIRMTKDDVIRLSIFEFTITEFYLVTLSVSLVMNLLGTYHVGCKHVFATASTYFERVLQVFRVMKSSIRPCPSSYLSVMQCVEYI